MNQLMQIYSFSSCHLILLGSIVLFFNIYMHFKRKFCSLLFGALRNMFNMFISEERSWLIETQELVFKSKYG